jgi:uncharacterized protein YbjT (DUF2867 family)
VVEDAAVTSGLEWVSLRASFFARNTLDAWGAQIRASDVVYGPYASFAEAPIHERDLAASPPVHCAATRWWPDGADGWS